MRSKQHR